MNEFAFTHMGIASVDGGVPKLLKLTTGEDVVAVLYASPEESNYYLAYPMKLITRMDPDQNMAIVVWSKWLFASPDMLVPVHSQDVVCISHLYDSLIAGYLKNVADCKDAGLFKSGPAADDKVEEVDATHEDGGVSFSDLRKDVESRLEERQMSRYLRGFRPKDGQTH